MAKEYWQKAKLLKLARLLWRETDEQQPLTTAELCKRMEEMDIPCNRKTLSQDIALLNEMGVGVLWKQVDKSKAYYIKDRMFSPSELKILMDAVQAANFVTPKKSRILIAKLIHLGGQYKGDLLERNLVCFNTRKHSNETIYYSVDAIEYALRHERKLSFRYFDWDINRMPVYRKNGACYLVDPISLVYHHDNYYLGTLSPQHEGVVNYRVDRMEQVVPVEEEIYPEARILRHSVGEYTEQAFLMFTGPVETVDLELEGTTINAVWDHFGDSVTMRTLEEGKVHATVQVQISPTFWSWIFQFGDQMRIVGPEKVVNAYMAYLRTQCQAYE